MNWQDIAANPWADTAVGLAALIALALLSDWLARYVVLRSVRRGLSHLHYESIDLFFKRVAGRFAHIVPALFFYRGISLVPNMTEWAVTLISNVAAAFIVLTTVFALNAALDLVNELYRRRPDANARPIKGYLQVVKIVLYGAGVVLVIASLLDRSPLLLLSGLGALAAVLMLVFKDTILSLVASVQLTSNDMIRIGDWIEMDQLGADGDVIDIALHTVKVQNWDKTITTIPTHRLISESFKNWRGMSESGGRRIKRALFIDQNSVRFLAPGESGELAHIALIADYLKEKENEIAAWNAALAERGRAPINMRRLTNLGTFRAYTYRYLRAHPSVNQNMTLLVRQRAPGANGLPLEIYCFTSTTAWGAYEDIQSDIFDHLIAILPEFDLRLHQMPSGHDVAAAFAARP